MRAWVGAVVGGVAVMAAIGWMVVARCSGVGEQGTPRSAPAPTSRAVSGDHAAPASGAPASGAAAKAPSAGRRRALDALGRAAARAARADLPAPEHVEGEPAPGVAPPIDDAQREQTLVREFFEQRVNPRLRACLRDRRPSGSVKFSFVFVKDDAGTWKVAASADDLARAGVEDADGLSLVDSTLPEDQDEVVVRCMWEATSGVPLEPAARHAQARYYRVYWRWSFE
ncbi:MAG: hypothetical protein D6689_07640 [Deltaproteobacteria bacterium]|nr:MAG: hypothetical protein D6689_07640 [Deltaproteobacteria bacterium]